MAFKMKGFSGFKSNGTPLKDSIKFEKVGPNKYEKTKSSELHAENKPRSGRFSQSPGAGPQLRDMHNHKAEMDAKRVKSMTDKSPRQKRKELNEFTRKQEEGKDPFKMKGMKFYGDRTRKEMRQDLKEHRKSLGGDKDAIKADRRYQRGRKKELRGEELLERGQKRGQRKVDRGSKITEGYTEPRMATQKVRKFTKKRKHKKNLEQR